MNRNFQVRSVAFASLVALAACGGGGSLPDVGSTPAPTPEPEYAPIPDLRSVHYQEALGLVADQPAQVTSVATIDAQGAAQRKGSISLVTDPDRNGAQYPSETVELAVTWEGTGDVDYVHVPVGDDFFKDGATTVVEDQDQYGNRILIVENEAQGRRLYLPPEGSNVFVGALSSDHDAPVVAHAVFGRETLAEEIANVRDGFRFQGWAEASVVATDADGGPGRSGTYRGISGGHVDFVNGDFGLAAELRQNPNSRQSFGVQAWGTVTADGELIDTEAVFINARRAGEQFEGVFEGQVYGPEATDVGGTFSGNIDDDKGSASVVGQMLLSRQP